MEKATKTARQLLETKRLGPAGIVAIAPDDTVLQALTVMADKNTGAVAVLAGGKLVGIMTERDYARKVELAGKTARDTLVREIMTGNVFYVTSNDKVDKCRTIMNQHRIRHLPVCDNGRLIGMMSSRDILEEIIAEEEHLIQDLQTERLMMTTDTGTY
jgi:CBS domain-containing protein